MYIFFSILVHFGIGANIHCVQEIQSLPCAGFFILFLLVQFKEEPLRLEVSIPLQ